MYLDYYGLSRHPFDLVPDPEMVYLSDTHEEALAVLRYGIMDQKGFVLVHGAVGTGKTTVIHTLISYLPPTCHYCLISNPNLTANELFFYISNRLALGEYDGNKAKFLLKFGNFLDVCRANGENVALVIDEAHCLSVDLLEEIRLLSNQGMNEGRLSVLLIGQPEISALLDHDRLLPLRQRISVSFELGPMSAKEVGSYIRLRLLKSGAEHLMFTESAIAMVAKCSGGVPRLINLICDHALLSGYSKGVPQISREIVKKGLAGKQIPGVSLSREGGWLPRPVKSLFQSIAQRIHLFL